MDFTGYSFLDIKLTCSTPKLDAWRDRFYWITSPEHRTYRFWIVPKGALARLNPFLLA